ncbi:unnamed protein product, partial [Ascophyllum nodosum]
THLIRAYRQTYVLLNEPLRSSFTGAGRLHADHRSSTLVLPRRLPSSWPAKSRKSRIGDAPQAQSANLTTPRLPQRRGTWTHAAVVRLVVGVPAGILMGASPRHAPPRSIKRRGQPGARGDGFSRSARMTPMNVHLSRNKSPDRDPSPACPC